MKINMPNMSTHADIIYSQDPYIEWGYHMCQIQKLLLESHFDYTTILSYGSLKSG